MHSADKLAEMQTKFHVIQAKLIMSVWCFTVHCEHDEDPPALLPPPLLVPVVLLEDGAELQVGQHEPHRRVQGAGTGRLCNNN